MNLEERFELCVQQYLKERGLDQDYRLERTTHPRVSGPCWHLVILPDREHECLHHRLSGMEAEVLNTLTEAMQNLTRQARRSAQIWIDEAEEFQDE